MSGHNNAGHGPIREKRHRLPLVCYRGMVTATFVICIENRIPVFTEDTSVPVTLDCLRQAIRKYGTKNVLYVIMPDHVHCILTGATPNADLWKAAGYFSRLGNEWLEEYRSGIRWQKDFLTMSIAKMRR
jgi:REP element-mobilizing transposase RayT